GVAFLYERLNKVAYSVDNLSRTNVVTVRSELGIITAVEHNATVGVVDRVVGRKVGDRTRPKASKDPIELFSSTTYIRQPLTSCLEDTVVGRDLGPNIFKDCVGS